MSICIQDIVPSRIPSNQGPISAKHHQRKARREMITTTSYGVHSAILLVLSVNPKLRFMHKNGVQAKPDGPLMGGGAGMPH